MRVGERFSLPITDDFATMRLDVSEGTMMSLEAFRLSKHLQVVSVGDTVKTMGGTEKHEESQAEFGQQARPTDVIYYYCSDQSEWDRMKGSEGYLLMRDGEIVDSIVRRMN